MSDLLSGHRDEKHLSQRRVFLRLLIAILLLVFVYLQYRLWVGEGSVAEIKHLATQIEQQEAVNITLSHENEKIAAQVEAFKNDLDEVEYRARNDLGLIKPDETFYIIIEE